MEKEIKVKAKDEDLKGNYSNLMRIFHNKEEFVLDFFFATPPEGVLTSRIIMSPSHLRRMVKALEENMDRYEKRFGKIEETEGLESDIGFKSNN